MSRAAERCDLPAAGAEPSIRGARTRSCPAVLSHMHALRAVRGRALSLLRGSSALALHLHCAGSAASIGLGSCAGSHRAHTRLHCYTITSSLLCASFKRSYCTILSVQLCTSPFYEEVTVQLQNVSSNTSQSFSFAHLGTSVDVVACGPYSRIRTAPGSREAIRLHSSPSVSVPRAPAAAGCITRIGAAQLPVGS